MAVEPINLDNYQRIVVLTGAGISVASGLPTYRGEGGMWDDADIERLSHVETWRREPRAVWDHFGALRAPLSLARPNAAHLALANTQRALPSTSTMTVVTQNVDGLHGEAGSRDVVELHGNLRRTRCDAECGFVPFYDLEEYPDELPACPQCGALLRPDVTLFGEMLPLDAERASREALRDCDLFLAIGTSGLVVPAANFVRAAKYEGARTVLVNLEPMDSPNPYFDEQVLGRAEHVVPELLRIV